MSLDTASPKQLDCLYNETVVYFYNHSKKYISNVWRTQDYLVVSLGLAVCAAVILANVLVIAAIGINRRFHYPIYYLLGNLAAADLFAGMAYLYLMFHTGPWTLRLSVKEWFLRQGLIDTSLTASVLNLLAVAFERHQTIFTMQLHSKMTNRRVIMLILAIWVVAVFLGMVPSLGWHCLCQLSSCSTMAPMYSRSYLVFWAVLNLFTFSVMVAVYARIFLYVRHKSRTMSQHTTQAKHRQTVISLMKTVFMILSAFVVCWTPGLVVLLLDGANCTSCLVLVAEKFCLVLAECNSVMNPIIYSYRDQEMRSTFKRILCYCCGRGEGQQDEPLTTRFHTLKQETFKNSDARSKQRKEKKPVIYSPALKAETDRQT